MNELFFYQTPLIAAFYKKTGTCLLFFSLLVVGSAANSAPSEEVWDLPPDRSTDWSLAGMDEPFPAIEHVVTFPNPGDSASPMIDSSARLQRLINSIEEATVIQFGPGDYLFESPILISVSQHNFPLVLRGAGPAKTRFHFKPKQVDQGALILVQGAFASPSDVIEVLGEPEKDDQVITVRNTDGILPGSTWMISQQNDLNAMGTYLRGNGMPDRHIDALETWARRSVGQTLLVESVEGRQLTLKYPLTADYKWGDVQLEPLKPRERVGLEQFSIFNHHDLDGLHTLVFDGTANCRVSEIESYDTVKMHLVLRRSRNNQISGSLFTRAFRHGGGGHGYGVVASMYTNHCLVENNAFSGLRHSMMIKEGASANVFAYNYSTDGYQEGSTHARDISVHGHYPFMNLFEGNVVQYIHSTDYWGAAGPGNTFFRNKVTTAGLQLEDFSPRQNAIGNDLPMLPANPTWLYRPETAEIHDGVVIGKEVIDPLVIGNRNQANPTVEMCVKLPPSLYLKGPPPFWLPDEAWPAFGPATEFEAGTIPSQIRWQPVLD